ncbi:hypothetical protein F2Q68_00019903 [Brassica cretica]|uniref:Arabidopsis retrotransposon Orf1 C-terminal domain-containing protein n=1 Tax=Brassica cretica TaxID=69181 RepID=A0A8S9FUT1_BRACR|nr:hypothetical protein F2Q68_00019903 [Brassica cretica]
MRLRVWKVKKSCVSLTTMSGYQPRNNQQSGYQPRNNQQGSYQPQQNPPPGFNNKGNHSSQQKAHPSTSTPQESNIDALLKQILESQTRSEKHVGYELKNLHSKIDGSYNDLNNKFKALENQFAAMNTHQNRQQGSLPGKSEQNPKETMKAITLRTTHHSDTPMSLGLCRFESDVPQRLPQVAPQPVQVTMVKKIKGKLDAEKQEAEREDSALSGKALASKPAGSGTQRTSRQQTLAAKKSKEQEKRAGKSVAVPTNEETGDKSEDEQAPTKKAKMSKGKAVVVDRDREKTPSVEELYEHLLNGAMMGPLKMQKLLTIAYPVYKDVSCQFLSSLEVTYHNTLHVRQGWGKIKFKVNGRDYNMNFKDIGRVMGFQDLEDSYLPKCENLPTELWKLITGNMHSTGTDKSSHIRHPSVRYLHRILVRAFYPRKEACNVTEEDIRLLCPAIRPYAAPGVLPLPSTDIYATFGMVSFFVSRLEHYRDWACLFPITHSPFPFNQSKVPMVKKTKGKLDAEKQEAEREDSALKQEKRAGKSVAVPTNEESDDESGDEQAHTKKAKMSKGKVVVVDRDREKTPSVEELYEHLLTLDSPYGVTWIPTRFADLDLLKEMGLDSDIEAMLGHLKMPKLLTMAYPVYKDVSCQFLSSLEVTYHNTPHVRQGWGKIKFKVNGRDYNMNFKDIGRVMGFQDLEDSSLPKCENIPTELWKLITGNRHSTGTDKNSHIRHPSVRYLNRMLVHAFYPRKEVVLPLPSTDIYATFGMVSFFVIRLEHYGDWAWYTSDSRPKVGIGGLITQLLQFMNVPFGKDVVGPRFIDGTYLRIATYFSGMYGKNYVYYYYLKGKHVEVVLPNKNLTSLERPGAISFNISQENFLGEHRSHGPIAAPRKRSAPTRHNEPAAESSKPVYGPLCYYFKPYAGFLPPGALRDAHEHIGRLQRWNKAQDMTIEKLKDKCKALCKTVKKQAKTSAKFMKKVADVLTRGGIAGCSSADFAFANTSAPQPPPQPADLGFPLTARQLQRKWRNPPIEPSTS